MRDAQHVLVMPEQAVARQLAHTTPQACHAKPKGYKVSMTSSTTSASAVMWPCIKYKSQTNIGTNHNLCFCLYMPVFTCGGDLIPGLLQELEDALLQVLDCLNSSSSHGDTAAVQATLALTRMAGASS